MFDFLRAKREKPILPDRVIRCHYRFYGDVQGVGFRYRAKYAAQSLELTGWVQNLDDGSVEMEVQGYAEQIDQMLPLIRRSDWIVIRDMRMEQIPVNPWENSFMVRGY